MPKAKDVDWRAVLGPRFEPPANLWLEDRWLYYAPTGRRRAEPAALKAVVKDELGGRYDTKRHIYRMPRLRYVYDALCAFDSGVTRTSDVLSWSQPLIFDIEANLQTPEFQNLYPFQQRAIKMLLHADLEGYEGDLLAFSPGLGKTPTSIVAADVLGLERICVVAPLTLLANWCREIERWSTDPDVELCHGDAPSPSRWSVVNYDTIRSQTQFTKNDRGEWMAYAGPWLDAKFDLLILDESILLKGRKTKRTKAIGAMDADRRWLLSGAPVARDNSDLFAQLNIIEPDYFTSFWRFARKFCYIEIDQWSQAGTITGSRTDINLRETFPELMIVENQEDVLPDLPDYIYQDLPVTLTPAQRRMHDEVMSKWTTEIEGREEKLNVTAVVAEMTRLQQITSNLINVDGPDESAKADALLELIENGGIEYPLLVWVNYRKGAEALVKRIDVALKEEGHDRHAALVLGGMTGSDAMIEGYKDGAFDVLVFSMGTGKYGHTLTNTKTVAIVDKTWDSDAWFQMLHRVRRNGLTHSPRLITLRARNTIDDYVELNLAGKLPSMANVTGANLAKIMRSLGEEFAALEQETT